MERFIIEQNLLRFRKRLADAVEPAEVRWLEQMVASEERKLALIITRHDGVCQPWERIPFRGRDATRAMFIGWFRKIFADVPQTAALIDPAPGLPIAAVNHAFAGSAAMTHKQIEGRPFFELFPDNPGDPTANGASNFYHSLKTVSGTGSQHRMNLQRYDMKDPTGSWVARYWFPVNTPLQDEEGRLMFVLNIAEETSAA